MEKLITEHLILRKARETDLEKIWNNIWRDEKIAETMLWETTKTYEEAVDRLNRTIKYQTENFAYFVCLKSNDEPIGFAGVKEIEQGIYEDGGICIARKHQGRGYAKEVVQALKYLVFEKLNGNRFLYGCFSDNERSRKVCISQGFKYLNSENVIRDWDKKEFIVDYYFFDKEMYSTTKIIYFVHGTTTDNAEKLCSGWKEAIEKDWRKTGDWQPGWEYII
ncbi:MAG: GNAT family N-acetyltransferase [Clostridia bacterium]|nr:GNAT family N-acetyltransferase [Clostridia bacterium]